MGGVDTKTIKAMMKEVESLSKTIAIFKGIRDRSLREPDSPERKARLRKVNGHINFLEGFMKKLRETLENETEEKKKKREKMRMIKTGYYLAAIYNRQIAGYSADIMNAYGYGFISAMPSDVTVRIISAFQSILHSAKESNVKAEELDRILNDKEFFEMEKKDPTRLAEKKKEINEEFNTIITQIAVHDCIKLETDEKGNIKKESIKKTFDGHMMQKNGFEKSMKSFERYMPEIKVKDFQDIIKETEELAKTVRAMQTAYINNNAGFDRSNGYTRELLTKENSLKDKVKAYNARMAAEMEDALDPSKPGSVNDLINSDFMMRYALMRELDYHVSRQVKVDDCLVRNNEILTRMEEWEVYKDMRSRMSELGKEGSIALQIRIRACSKVKRLKSEALEHDDARITDFTDCAVEATQDMLDIITENGELGPKQQQVLEEGVASLVLYHMLIEYKGENNEARPFIEELKKSKEPENFKIVAKTLMAAPEFREKYRDMFGDKPKKSDFFGFLAGNLEKDLSLVPVKEPEKPKIKKKT